MYDTCILMISKLKKKMLWQHPHPLKTKGQGYFVLGMLVYLFVTLTFVKIFEYMK